MADDRRVLPPGQRAVEGFPRFGTHFHLPAPRVPVDPAIELSGRLSKLSSFPIAQLAALPRKELTADFHCVAGWSAAGLRWEGVAFRTLYRRFIEPLLQSGAAITHFVFEGLDGYRSIVLFEDALADDVLIADRLNGRPLDSDHGAPARLVSPSQYGYISTKHLCRIELHAQKPAGGYHPSRLVNGGLQLVKPHERARVWQEERHRYLPARFLRPIYRRLIPPIRTLSAHGGRPVR